MDNPTSKAVFLSYASQDSDAARRIAEALRAAGIEVWFDQNELRGGDAWDAKIRRQIKECALFLPVISHQSQTRAEGYFRLEWKLAVDRSHLMADDTPFLMPVVIDDTADSNARVPERFLAVQWTRLPGGETPAEFCTRMQNLLTGDDAGSGQAALRPASPIAGRRTARRVWLWPVMLGVGLLVAASAVWLPWRRTAPTAPSAPATRVAVPPVSEVHQLITRAQALWNKQDDATRDDWELAEQLAKRAVELDSSDGEAWAIFAQVAMGAYVFGYERTPEIYAKVLSRAKRAVALAPNSAEGRFALANCYRWRSTTLEEGVRMLQELVQQNPTDKRMLRILAAALRRQGKREEALAWLERAIALPGGDPLALIGKATPLRLDGRYAEAEAAIDQSLALHPGPAAYLWKVNFLLHVHGDLEQARIALGKVPTPFLIEEQGAYVATEVWLWKRDSARCLAALQMVPRDFLGGLYFSDGSGGPKAFFSGFAHHLARRSEAAQADWRTALRVVEQRLAAEPNTPAMLYWKARLLACLDDHAPALQAFQLFGQFRSSGSGPTVLDADVALLFDRLGQQEKALQLLERGLLQRSGPLLRTRLRLDPQFDSLRAHPRFGALLARTTTPAAPPVPDGGKSPDASAPPAGRPVGR